MQPDTGKYLGHILDSINEIENFMSDVQKYEDFDKNKMLVRAVERNFEIIGEAFNRIKQSDTSINISNMRAVISLRNRVIHAYDSIDNAVLYSIVLKHIPNLKSEVEQFLKEN